MRYEILDDAGNVINTINVGSVDFMLSQYPNGNYRSVEESPSIVSSIPVNVTMRQARLALLAAGKLDAVNAAVAAMTGAQGDAARIEWEFSNDVWRYRPLVLALASQLGMTDADLDALFVVAAAIV